MLTAKSARLLRLSLLHLPRCVGSSQCCENCWNRRQKRSFEKLQMQKQKLGTRLTQNGTYVLETHRCRYCKSFKNHVGERKNHVSEPEMLPERIICASMFNDITEYGRKVQGKCLNSAKEVASCAAKFRPGYWCFCGPGSEPDLEIPHFASEEWDKLAAVITSEIITSKCLVFMCSNMLQTGIFTSKNGKPGMHVKTSKRNNLMLVNILPRNQLCLFWK